MFPKKDLTGQQFNDWTVLRPVRTIDREHSSWVCRCVCGNEQVVRNDNLITGHSKGCHTCAKAKRYTSRFGV